MFRLAVACAAIAVSSVACGAATSDVRGPERPLPIYAGHDAELFDDAIEPEAVGYDRDPSLLGVSSSPEGVAASSPLLLERAQVADAVARARLTTITSNAPDRGWQIGFHTLERLAGAGPLPDDFAVMVGPAGPAAGILRAYEGSLAGKTFIVFVREFTPAEAAGESNLHVHLARDDKAGVAAVRAAVALAQVR
jgi:hypothetical protein